MKRFFKRVKAHFTSNTQTAAVIMDELDKPIPPITEGYYQPYIDEPSVFHMDPVQVNPDWVEWAVQAFSLSHVDARVRAAKHKQHLVAERGRVFNNVIVPDILVNTRVKGASKLALSMEWVIWYAHVYKITLQEAHIEGTFLTTRQESIKK